MTDDNTVLVLASPGRSTDIVVSALESRLGNVHVLLEKPVKPALLIRNRIRRLGIVEVAGQLAFMSFVRPLLKFTARKRLKELNGLLVRDWPPSLVETQEVPSVNSVQARELIREIDPAVVVVNGTRIIKSETLDVIDVPVLNMHAGITPLYRGVHGGYWALAEGRPNLVGTTIHLVDEGIDTGRVVEQIRFEVAPSDNFCTYPLLHLVAGLPALVRAVQSALHEGIRLRPGPDLPSRLRYHPALWTYLACRLRYGAK